MDIDEVIQILFLYLNQNYFRFDDYYIVHSEEQKTGLPLARITEMKIYSSRYATNIICYLKYLNDIIAFNESNTIRVVKEIYIYQYTNSQKSLVYSWSSIRNLT